MRKGGHLKESAIPSLSGTQRDKRLDPLRGAEDFHEAVHCLDINRTATSSIPRLLPGGSRQSHPERRASNIRRLRQERRLLPTRADYATLRNRDSQQLRPGANSVLGTISARV